jgi:flagellar hook-basal body complex protein FliE
MSLPIAPIPGIAPAASIAPAVTAVAPSTAAGGSAFRDLLAQSISTVEANRVAAETSVDRFLSGEGEELHHVAIATQKAELSFELFLQVRNKVVQAYQEIMRMPM